MLTLQRFEENRWRPLTAFVLKILDNVSSSGSVAGIAAYSHRGGTLRGTKFSNLYEYFKYIFETIPEIFGSPLVCRTWRVAVEVGSSNDFVGCAVFIYIFCRVNDYGFFVSCGSLNIRGTRSVFVVWRGITAAAFGITYLDICNKLHVFKN